MTRRVGEKTGQSRRVVGLPGVRYVPMKKPLLKKRVWEAVGKMTSQNKRIWEAVRMMALLKKRILDAVGMMTLLEKRIGEAVRVMTLLKKRIWEAVWMMREQKRRVVGFPRLYHAPLKKPCPETGLRAVAVRMMTQLVRIAVRSSEQG